METLPAGAPTLKRPPAKGAKGAPASVADTATVIAPRKPSAAGLGSSSDAATMLKASGPGPQTGAAAADEAGSAPPSSASTGLAKGELRTVGPYRIVKVLGRGGMGVVYKAMDTRLGRTVALKVLRTTGDAHPDEIARFKLEAQNAAKLQHPNIVPIHDTGTVGDLDYFTMDYIEGGTLSQWVREKKPALAKRVAMLVKVASAIQHAHEQNVIHRDLKPANVMVDKQGEPHVMDFGLARNIGTAQGLTVSGTALGTPQYMPPEQAKGSLKEVGPHSDIWALGAVLYELLCGKTPFQGETVFQILRAVVQDDPVPPRKLVRNLPRDLDTICLKCLEKDAARRYASAAALADDLQAHLDGDAISARPLSRVEQAWRATRKRPVLATCAALLLVFGGVAVWLLQSTSATTRAGALGHEIAASLPDGVPTTAELQLLDGRCEELEALDKNAAIAARREINKRFAEALGRQVRALRLEAAELPAVETNLKVLAGRDPAVGAALEKEYRQHLASWDILFELVWPFKDLAAVFDEKLARTDAGGLYGATMKKSPAGPLLATRIDAGGNTRLEAGFAGWQDAAQLGVGLKSDGGRGYAFVLAARKEVLPTKGELLPPEAPAVLGNAANPSVTVTLQVWRAGNLSNEVPVETARLAGEQLFLRVQREGSKFTVDVGGVQVAVFDDPFPLPAREKGCFEVLMPGGVRLKLLRAARQTQPSAPSPLEIADDLHEQGKDEEALLAYREQTLRAATGDFGQELRYKQGLCLMGLRRQGDAVQLFEAVGGEEGNRWPLLALCQLMLIRIEKKEVDQVWALIEQAQLRFEAQVLMVSIPEKLRERIRELFSQGFSGLNLIGATPERVAMLERAMKTKTLVDPSRYKMNWLRWNLVRAKHLLGDFPAAERYAREAVALISEGDFWYRPVLEELCWLLRLRQQAPAALKLLDSALLGKGGKPLTDRLSLLVERARIHAALEQWTEAEGDLELFFKSAAPKDIPYKYWAAGRLLQGCLAERRGDKPAQEEAWLAGTVEQWCALRKENQFPVNTMEKVLLLHLSALTGTLKRAHLDAILDVYGDTEAQANPTSAVQALLRNLYQSGGSQILAEGFKLTPESAIALWQNPHGRAVARAQAFLNVPLGEIVGGPMCLFWLGMVQSAVARPLSAEEDALLWEAGKLGFERLKQGKLSITHIAQLAMSFSTGETGMLGWGGLAKALPPEVRGPFGYFLGFRLEALGKGSEALGVWRAALKDAPPNSLLQKLAGELLKKQEEKK